MKNDSCVYIHTRSDGVVFYVGIGNPRRPYSLINRNQHWHSTTDKYAYTVTILYENLSWEAACALEVQLITKYRELSGGKLCNQTLGGDGPKGNTFRKGAKHTPESIAKMREAKSSQSSETRAMVSASMMGNKNSLGYKQSAATREKISAALKNRPPISDETRAKLSAAAKNRITRMKEIA